MQLPLKTLTIVIGSLSFGIAAEACRPVDAMLAPPTEAPFEIAVEVTSDPETPLPGVPVQIGATIAGKSDAHGLLHATLEGAQGSSVQVAARCPQGFDAPQGPVTVMLRRFAPGSPTPTYSLRCAPTSRALVAAIRAENGPNLPVIWLGREVARTDASGVAHVVFNATPGDAINLVLGTNEGDAKRLRPQNPTLSLQPRDVDDYVVLDQKFIVEPKPQVVHKVVHRAGPQRI